jgi:glycosyltransferase involved in cell wall biosynthesis
MRICFFNDIDVLGGGEIWVLRTCRYMQSVGHHVTVVCPYGSELQVACEREGIDVFTPVEATRTGQSFITGLHRFLHEQSIDLMYCTVIGAFCEARVLDRVAERVNQERDGDKLAIVLKAGLPPSGDLTPEYYGAGAGPAVRRLHVVAAKVRDAFCAWEPGMADGFVEVMYEGIDLSEFQPVGDSSAEAKKRWNVTGKTVVTCLARLVDGMKGQSVLLRAVPDLLKVYPATTFLIAGDGKDRELLEELRDDLDLDGAVRFVGRVEDVRSLLAATDVLCHPSLHDGLPNSIIEAMAMSRPVVASRLGGIPEVVEHGVTGMLVRANDVPGLNEALRAMLEDQRARAAMGERGRAAIQERFDLHANLGSLAAKLEAELDAFRAAPERRTAPPPSRPSESVPVMFLMNVIRTGGEETELGLLARHLDKRRFPMSVLTLWTSDEAAPVVQELDAWNIPIDRTCASLEDDRDKVRYIVDRIRRDRIGIVVACQNTQLAYRAFEQLSPDECRLIEHGGIMSDVGNVPKDRTARFVGVSTQITEAAAVRMREPRHAVFIPSMVDIEVYDGPAWASPRALTAQWLSETLLKPFGFSADACVVVFVGRLDARKRVEDFIHAARRLEGDCPDALFLIVGGRDAYQPEYENMLRAEASDLGERHRLVFTGARSDVPGILAASHILVLPSVGEGMAHVINEAGAAGLAVVATDDGAAREQLENGRCGDLVEPRNVEQLTRSLRSLIHDRERQTVLGGRLREKVRAEYAARVVIAQWHTMLSDVKQELSDRMRRANGRRPHGRTTPRARGSR